MDLELENKVAVVTGANKGIGFAVTQALVKEGAYVVAGSLTTENLDRLDRVVAVPVNLMAADGPALLVQRTIDEHGHLTITDRKKELFKSSGGKWISPSRIETAIKRSIDIGQVMAFGNNMPHPAVLVAPNWDLIRHKLDMPDDTPTSTMAVDPHVRALMIREARDYTADLPRYEQIERVAILPRDLTIEDGELSPTLKIKRRVVEARYADLIAHAYAEDLHARTA